MSVCLCPVWKCVSFLALCAQNSLLFVYLFLCSSVCWISSASMTRKHLLQKSEHVTPISWYETWTWLWLCAERFASAPRQRWKVSNLLNNHVLLDAFFYLWSLIVLFFVHLPCIPQIRQWTSRIWSSELLSLPIMLTFEWVLQHLLAKISVHLVLAMKSGVLRLKRKRKHLVARFWMILKQLRMSRKNQRLWQSLA